VETETETETNFSFFRVVPQDTILFNDTVMYNIMYGNPNATKEDVSREREKRRDRGEE
jgi:ABC-type transport system involved in Fe-S cluster assembly fused permease/ATPase subunit